MRVYASVLQIPGAFTELFAYSFGSKYLSHAFHISHRAWSNVMKVYFISPWVQNYLFTTLKTHFLVHWLMPSPHYPIISFPLKPSSLSVFYSQSLVNSCWLLSFVLSLIGLSHSYFLFIPFPFLFSYILSSFLQFIFPPHKLWFLLLLNTACRLKIIVTQNQVTIVLQFLTDSFQKRGSIWLNFLFCISSHWRSCTHDKYLIRNPLQLNSGPTASHYHVSE